MKWYMKHEEKLFKITMVVVTVALVLYLTTVIVFLVRLK